MQGNRTSARLGLWLAGALTGLLLFATPASATFHLMKIREVYPAGNASYVELQLLEAGEYQVGGHHLVAYNADGTVAHDLTLSSNASPSSAANATVLIAGSGYAGSPSADEVDSGMNLSAAGGAVCWVEGEPPDCVAWGNFSATNPAGNSELLVGGPASPAGVTAGKALRRAIGAVCPTFLEAGDDTDDSEADFAEVTPGPRNNASPVTETRCVVPGTAIDSKPKSPTNATSAGFTYHPVGTAEELASIEELECKIDDDDFVNCDTSPFQSSGPLADGVHTFEVRAVTDQGAGLPAIYSWTVDTQPPTTTIANRPDNPSPGSVSFSYESSELSSSFECSLAQTGTADGFASCPSSGNSYSNLADGVYAFKVRATDRAGNLGSTAAFSWQVDNSFAVVSSPPASSSPATVTIPQATMPTSTTPTARRLTCRKGFVKKKVRGKRRCVRKRRCRRVKVVVKKHGKKVKRWRRICAKKHRRRHGKRGHGKRRHKKRRTHRG
ncbi:MAG TPA: hypothetical protein VJ989_01435 [Solirubrobacterales bacterium]|nr:hypothetical protein [Solirubrobacterales bacterium]